MNTPTDTYVRIPGESATLFAAALGEDTEGTVVLPGDADWDTARTPWQLGVDQRPVAVVLARSPDDVARTVRAAGEVGLRVAPQSTGHNANPLGPLDDTVLLRTAGLGGVEIDVERRAARVGAGVVWGEVSDAAAEVGLAALAGSARDVGVVGYSLGGGVSWLARSHGLATNQILAVEIVTADGRLRRVDSDHDPDLFWAVRGGGGSFGVVTALELRLFPIREVVAGTLFWPLERAAEVLHTWRRWTATVPDEVTSIGRLLRFPPVPDIPEPLRGRSLVAVELASLLDAAATNDLLTQLRALGPEMDTVGPTPVEQLAQLHMDPPGPVPVTGDGLQLDALPDSALDAYLDVVGPGTDMPLLTTELRHLGGALVRGRIEGGAVSGLDGQFLVYSGGITPDAGSAAAAHVALDAIASALAPWSAGALYGNFSESPRPAAALYAADTLERLRQVKAAHDPHDRIRANHPIPPAGS
ncbi:FAD-linked oxidase [Actinomycetospora sp. NBRC 106375]|uniref:FAD-binding oxidoreductase n=1 Tax=Actinomycetospora sp. NBRC 106375 TaxID=3032207 RepID=UPI0024A0DC28|nr:FAD-binding oxidoreductase [Actinomycetospora sp. NBRC 106375]GLZ49745.1 FAD-linked oxidase [Actinomycetospora sp. NBRC 106375]